MKRSHPAPLARRLCALAAAAVLAAALALPALAAPAASSAARSDIDPEGAPDTAWQLQPTVFATVNTNGSGYYLGENAYYEADPYNYDRLAFSTKIGDVPQTLAILLTTRRNLTDFSVTITDDSGETLWGLGSKYLTKSYYYINGQTYISVVLSNKQNKHRTHTFSSPTPHVLQHL